MKSGCLRVVARRDSLPFVALERGLNLAVWLLVAVSFTPAGFGYVLSNPGARWPLGEIHFQTLLGTPSRTLLDGRTSWDDVAADAASLWNEELIPVRLSLSAASGSAGSRDGFNEVAWSSSVYGQSFGPAIAVAITWTSGGKVVESDILLDETLRWDSFRGSLHGHGYTNDLRRVLAHELGHSLGLNHPDEAGQGVEAIMNSIASDVDEPAADDIAGIQDLFPPETVRPTVAIKSPSSGARIFAETVVVSGTASDNALAEQVIYELNSSDPIAAITTNVSSKIQWTALLSLKPGSNTFTVHGVDTSSNESAPARRSFFRVVTNALLLVSNGVGTVSPNLNRIGLEIGRRYTVTAIPGTGHVFSNWTGGLASSSPRLGFLMESNLVLQANFVTNPFLPVFGSFNGLFMETNSPQHQSSGTIVLKVTDHGNYSGKLLLAGKSHSFSGNFDLDGRATNHIIRPGTNGSLTLNMQLGLTPSQQDQLAGTLSNGDWTADLRANRSVFNPAVDPAPWIGSYTFVVSGTNNPLFGPAGDGYATGKIDGSGALKWSGKLADATALSQKTFVSRHGEWPFYLALYSNKGSIFGWMSITNEPTLAWGNVNWFKPAVPKGLHAGGFTNQTAVIGSSYTPPATRTNRVLNFSRGTVTLSGGDLNASLGIEIDLGTDNKVSATNLSLTFTPSSGLFKGSFIDPSSSRKLAINGVALQNSNIASGFFAGTNESGWMLMQSAP